MSGPGDARPDVAAALAALRARGASRWDPVRFARLEAMARRAAAHTGAARQGLDARLLALAGECDAAVERACRRAEAASSAEARPEARPESATLSGLLAHVARHAGGGDPRAAADAPVELKALRLHRDTWARLSLDRRLTQSRSQVPANAGPLNTERLLHQALTALRATSPGYLQRVMAQVEALLWLEQAGAPAPRPAAGAPRRHSAPAARRGSRAR